MGHSSRRPRSNPLSGIQQRKGARVHVGSNGSPVRDGSIEYTSSGDSDQQDSATSGSTLGKDGESTPVSAPTTPTEARSGRSTPFQTASSSTKTTFNARTGTKGAKPKGRSQASSSSPKQTPKDVQIWDEHVARCLGLIPGLEHLSTASSKIEPGDSTTPCSGERPEFHQNKLHSASGAVSQYPFQPTATGTEPVPTRPPKPEWQLPFTESKLRSAGQHEKSPKQSRFFPPGASKSNSEGSYSLPKEAGGTHRDLFWETAARESRKLYAREPEISASSKDTPSDSGLPSLSSKLNDKRADVSPEAGDNDDPDAGWTLVQAEEAKSPAFEFLYHPQMDSKTKSK